MTGTYLETLNPDQRRAVEHGIGAGGDARPLLVIAGAGCGKNRTLGHRVGHIVVKGGDPDRVLLMTFSRRAAAEMTRRAERIVASALGSSAAGALAWSGTFHSIGARLLREYAGEIGLSPSFTIHDRGDAAALMNLAPHDLGFSSTKTRFPTNATCLAIYSRAVNCEAPLEEVLANSFPWCGGWEAELRKLFTTYVEAQQRQNILDYHDLFLYWAQMMAEPALPADVRAP